MNILFSRDTHHLTQARNAGGGHPQAQARPKFQRDGFIDLSFFVFADVVGHGP
jgi:hypothetical protein